MIECELYYDEEQVTDPTQPLKTESPPTHA